MRTRWLALIAMLTFGAHAQAEEPIALKVLYAGNPGSDRERDFTRLFEKHFAKVGTADYRTFAPAQAADYDVVILDWTSIYPRDKNGKIKEKLDGLDSPTPPKLSDEYDRPTILIGAAGGSVGQSLRLKIDWR
jgi:hypothetical protein